MTPELRPYQTAGIEAARAHVRAGRRRVIMCIPTGGGKTVLAASIIHSARRNFSARVLFVVHRKELVDQAVAQLAKWGVTELGVIRADDARTNLLMPVQVATIQSLSRRLAPAADIVFIDEAHRAAANSYRKLLALYPEATIFGLTATPCRADGKPLGGVFQAIEVMATYADLIRDGFIVEPRCFSSKSPPKLDGVRTLAGDFVVDELETAMMQADVLGDTLAEYKARTDGRKTVIFACTVAHSRAIEAQFIAAGVRIAHVDANTPEEERGQISRRLRADELDVVTNVGIYTEGWDEPCVKCIVLARPTKSLTLFMQMAGRALRPWNDVRPVLIDQGGNIDRHGWPHEDRLWSLDAGAKRREKKPAKCIRCGAFLKCYPCEECGYAPEVSSREVKIVSDARLEERPVERTILSDPRRAYFDAQLESARGRGFKPGFAAAKFKEKFGAWPPWSWSQHAKDTFAHDSVWAGRHKARETNKARWSQPEKQEPQYDTDEDFSAWVRDE